MPSPSTSQLPRPNNWQELELIAADVLRDLWRVRYIALNGRSGQKQDGVDIFARLDNGQYAGAQCKLTEKLTEQTIIAEVEAAKSFRPPLGEYIFVTTMSSDTKLQRFVRTNEWPFAVYILFWEDLSHALSGNLQLLEKHFPGWIKTSTSEEHIRQLLMDSQPNDFRYDGSNGCFFHKRDVDLRIALDRPGDGRDYQSFHEPWTKRFLDPNAYRQEVHIYYRGTRIFNELFVSVDGGRYLLPAPKSVYDMAITPFKFHIGRIINTQFRGYDYESGLWTAGIRVKAEESIDRGN